MEIKHKKEGQMTLNRWEDLEVKNLFSEVEETKKKGKAVRQAFIEHAKKHGRKPNSVRNYYYQEVNNLLADNGRVKELGIDISLHQKQEIKFFKEEEEEKIVKSIEALVNQGDSVRQACLKLSGGDVALMLRYQNKYRNHTIKSFNDEKPANILEFKSPQRGLSDSDLNSLFMGLVRLVKKTAIEETSLQLKKEKDSVSFLLKKTLIELHKKEREINILKEDILKLTKENKKLEEKRLNDKTLHAKLLAQKLSKFKAGLKES